jgi:hypothetical protein
VYRQRSSQDKSRSLGGTRADGKVGGGDSETERIGVVLDALDETVAIHVRVTSVGSSVSSASLVLLRVAVGVSVAVLSQGVLSLVLARSGHKRGCYSNSRCAGGNHCRCGGGKHCRCGSGARQSYSRTGGGYDNGVSVSRDGGVAKALDWFDNCNGGWSGECDGGWGGYCNGSSTSYRDSRSGGCDDNGISVSRDGGVAKALDWFDKCDGGGSGECDGGWSGSDC